MAYGFPCQVVALKYVAAAATLNVMCRDIFTGAPHCVQGRNAAQYVTFHPERHDHRVITTDERGVLTSTDDPEFAERAMSVQPGDIITTLTAPACMPGNGPRQWAANRVVEKITPGVAPTDAELLAELDALEA